MQHEFIAEQTSESPQHTGLAALCGIAAYYRIAADNHHLVKELALDAPDETAGDLVRAADRIGLKARIVDNPTPERLACAPLRRWCG